MNIEKQIEKLIKDKVIGEDDKLETRTILVWCEKGEKEAQKISKKAVKNLKQNGFVKNGKLLMGASKGEVDVWFLLAVAGAKGYIKQVTSKEGEKMKEKTAFLILKEPILNKLKTKARTAAIENSDDYEKDGSLLFEEIRLTNEIGQDYEIDEEKSILTTWGDFDNGLGFISIDIPIDTELMTQLIQM